MHYVSVENLTKSFVEKPLFTDITFNIEQGDKIALVAKNGAGKTTLLRVLAGKDVADSGKIWINKDVSVSFLDQNPEFDATKNVLENILSYNHPVINTIREYELAMEHHDEAKLSELMVKMDELGAWNFESTVKEILTSLSITDLEQLTGSMSGGQRKRLSLAKVLIDISFGDRNNFLILDEPTNHLDFEMIEWLAEFLSDAKTTLLLVTHDRFFLDNVCNEILELEDQRLYIHKGDFSTYLQRKIEREESEAASLDKARNLYRKELEWMRKQPKARTTKSKSRQDAFYDVEEKATARKADDKLQLHVKMTRIGGKILELKKVYKSFGEKPILKGFDYTFKHRERIGIIGKNGVGKSTFLNIIMGLEQADSGKINAGETIVFGYFHQQGLQVKEDKRVIEFVKDIAEHFPLADGTKVSAGQFLQLFQFTPEQQFTFISKLSGGEKKRLQLLSILFQNPNFLILDEPTNDLDLVTLAVLEDFLEQYQGCVIIVSHDRYFMDKLVDHLFVFEGNGIVSDFPGNYTEWRVSEVRKKRESQQQSRQESKPAQPVVTVQQVVQQPKPANKRKLSYKEKQEFDNLQKEIPELEKEKAELNEKLVAGGQPYAELNKMIDRIGVVTKLLEEKEMRWLELSELAE
ncbi:MAG TPA: ABC-F family ATP-binding cassette domain-containing protein [Chitinophagales bacterium]|nr:ABC-F family ATP-binding cassette domain-containing protein [Chitinophagales bacterium]